MKKIIILLTLLAMLLTFGVSCANGSNNGSGSDTVATSQAPAADSGTAEETAAPRHYPDVEKPNDLYADKTAAGNTFSLFLYTLRPAADGSGYASDYYTFYGIEYPTSPLTEAPAEGISFRLQSGSMNHTDPRYAETYFIPSGDRECDYLRAVLTQGSYTVKATENAEITSDADARGFHASIRDPMLTVYEYTDGKLTAYYSVHPNGRFSVTRAGSDETLFSESVLEEKDIALLYAMVTKYLTAEIAESAGDVDYTTRKGDVTVTDGTKTVTISRDDFTAICQKLLKRPNLSLYSRKHRGAELPSSDRMLTITSIDDKGKPRLAYIVAGNDDTARIYTNEGTGQAYGEYDQYHNCRIVCYFEGYYVSRDDYYKLLSFKDICAALLPD